MYRNFPSFLLLLPGLLLAGCGGGDDDLDSSVAEGQDQFVTVNVKDRYGFRIRDPLGQRITGATCGAWRDQTQEQTGECCWNVRTECACPCPER